MHHSATAGALLLLLLSLVSVVNCRFSSGDVLKLPSEASKFFHRPIGDDDDDGSVGTRWAVLIAGSNGYWNYRHQVYLLYSPPSTCNLNFIQFNCISISYVYM